MTQTLSSEIKVSLGWLHQDVPDVSTIIDGARLEYHVALPDGAGADEADRIWHDERTLAAGDSEELDLSALPMMLFGDSLSVAMAKVKALLLINLATDAGDGLLIGDATSHAWQGPLAAAGDKLLVPADSCLLLVNKKNGWTVLAGSADRLKIANAGANEISYKIAIVGASA